MKALSISDTLPNHKFEVIGGDSVWLKDLLSDKCVLTVMLPDCHECLVEAQELKSAISSPDDAKYFIFVTWENPRTFEDMKVENGLTSPFLYDHKGGYFSKYDIHTFPFNITLDSQGVVLDMLSGAMWKEDFQKIIESNKLIGATTN
ncbi:MAG: peroxiredoxin family protein [Nitrososphaerales archaeon]